MAREFGLAEGGSLELTTFDERGMPWDFGRLEMRKKALDKVNVIQTRFSDWIADVHKHLRKYESQLGQIWRNGEARNNGAP